MTQVIELFKLFGNIPPCNMDFIVCDYLCFVWKFMMFDLFSKQLNV